MKNMTKSILHAKDKGIDCSVVTANLDKEEKRRSDQIIGWIANLNKPHKHRFCIKWSDRETKLCNFCGLEKGDV